MSGIASTLRKHWVELAWGSFAAINIGVIVALDRWETIPFHLVWVSLTLVYGLRVWRLRSTLGVLAIVMALTGAALAFTVVRGHENPDEVAEVPLMAAMFLAMVWHAERRQSAIREAHRLAAREHELLERQREFVRDASHELRTPITIARGHAELVRSQRLDPQTVQDVDVVLDELNRLSRLSERLLILAAAEHRAFLSIETVDVDSLVSRIERRWIAATPRVWNVDSDVGGTVDVDRERLEIALDAVIENAVKATGTGEPIRICATADGTDLILEITDGGRGIPDQQLERIFDRFTRADAERDRGGGGTGLGLPIARTIAVAHGGDLSVASQVGVGTTMRFRIPGLERPVVVPQLVTEASAREQAADG